MNTKLLFEKYGFKDFDNPLFFTICEVAANNVELLVSKYGRKSHNNLYMIYPERQRQNALCGYSKTSLSIDGKLDWIESLDIYVKVDPSFNSPYDAMCLYDIGMYDLKTDGIDKYNLVISREDRPSDKNIPFIMMKDKIVRASVSLHLKSSDSISHEELIFVMMHEFGHLYDVFAGKVSFTFLNRNITNMPQIAYPKTLGMSQFKIIEGLINGKYSTEKMKTMFNEFSFSVDVIYGIVCNCNYALNISEARQRLKNFVYDLRTANSFELNVGKSNSFEPNERFEKKLIKASTTYNSYYNMASLFRMLIKYVPDGKKRVFADEYIKEHISRPVSSVGCYRDEFRNNEVYTVTDFRQFGVSFSDNGKFNEKSFDKMFGFFVDRIDKIFLSKACQIASDVNSILNPQYSIGEMWGQCRNMTPYIRKYTLGWLSDDLVV